jgi:hypothetical protein
MPIWLETLGDTVLSVAICDRCKRKVPYSSIRADGNIPSIRVCGDGCSDNFDPYRLPARPTEKISIRFPRPDADIAVNGNQISVTVPNELLSLEQTQSNNGNMTGITYTPVNPNAQ